MAAAKHFRDLTCWQLSRELKLEIYRFADAPHVRNDLRFYSDLRAAAASAPANIAEGFNRRTHAEFSRFLDIARGSIGECQNHLVDAVDRNYLKQEECDRLLALASRAGGAIAGLQRYLRGGK